MIKTMLFFYTPIGMSIWIMIALWHLRRRHQIREKSTALYYLLLPIDAAGFVADVLANYSWASLILFDLPRFDKREITISQHMGRINENWKRLENPTIRQKWSHFVSSRVCAWLNKMDPSGHHC